MLEKRNVGVLGYQGYGLDNNSEFDKHGNRKYVNARAKSSKRSTPFKSQSVQGKNKRRPRDQNQSVLADPYQSMDQYTG